MTEFTEPLWTIGDLGQLESSPGGTILLPEPSGGMGIGGGSGLGPSGFFGGTAQLDMRYTFLKDLIQGYVGRVPSFLESSMMLLVDAVPMAANSSNIAALQTLSSGVSMTLATTPVVGISVNLPIIPFTGVLGNLGTATSATTAPIVLDYGFDWMALTNGSTLATVVDSTLYNPGMPLCIAGTSTSTVLLTNVFSINSATVVTLANPATFTSTQTPVGTGDRWGPSEFASNSLNAPNSPFPTPLSAWPYVAFGPGLFLDTRQALSRCVSVTPGSTLASVATFTVSGWDIYWQPMTQTLGPITPSGGVVTTYSKKAFKAINTIIPNVTDGHSWSSGTGDSFGFPIKTDRWEYADISFGGTFASSSTGFTVPDFTSPASATTGDVRGTMQYGSLGSSTTFGGAGAGGSNGTVASLVVSGRRLVFFATLGTWDQLNARLTAPQWQTGRPQV